MRYYFHVRDGDVFIPDLEGSEMPSLAAARAGAHHSARDFCIGSLRSDMTVNGRRVEIADDAGRVLDTLSVRDVMASWN